MPAPTLVAIGTPAQSPFGTPGPAITLTAAAHAPAGVGAGDRLLCCVRVRRSGGIATFTPLNSEWSVVAVHQTSSLGGQSQTMGVLTARHSAAAWPLTIEHNGIATGAEGLSDVHAVVGAWRPSFTPQPGVSAASTASPGPFGASTLHVSGEGTVVAFASMWAVGSTINNHSYGALAAAEGFTELADITGWPWQPTPAIGNLKIADRPINATMTTGLPRWTPIGSGTRRQVGIAVLLDDPDPPPPTLSRPGFHTGIRFGT